MNPFLPSPWEGDLSPSLPFPMALAHILSGRREAVVPHFSNFLSLFLQPKICIKFQTLQKLVFWTILAIFRAIFANFSWILLHFGFHLGHFFIILGDCSFALFLDVFFTKFFKHENDEKCWKHCPCRWIWGSARLEKIDTGAKKRIDFSIDFQWFFYEKSSQKRENQRSLQKLAKKVLGAPFLAENRFWIDF